jgi:undecaprenyl phosphate-alpha-L-ara4N flippase subunit ArnE
MKILALILSSSLASGLGQILLRGGAKAALPFTPDSVWRLDVWFSLLNWQLLAGLLAWGISTALWLIVLNQIELTYAYYVASLNYLLIPLADRWLYDERLNGTRLAGMALILLGVLVTIYGRSAER